MAAAGYEGAAVNVGDHDETEWATVRQRAEAAGMWCGPWQRVAGPGNVFDFDRLDHLLWVAGTWGSPVIVNAESELKGSGDELTSSIAEACRGYDAAVSMEWRPFDDVYWVPLGEADIPVLPQLFPEAGVTDAIAARDLWHSYGVRCVYATFASYGGRVPGDYVLQAPYSVYTADDMGGQYAAWSPTSSGYVACLEAPVPPPTNGGGGDVTATGKGAATSADAAFEAWLESTAKPDAWRAQNPGEWAAVQEYREAPDGTTPPTVKTATGRMLLEMIEARRYAEGSHA